MRKFIIKTYKKLPKTLREILGNLFGRPITPISLAGLALYMILSFFGDDTPPPVNRALTAGPAGQALIGQVLTGEPYVIDGDTLVLNDIRVRFHGIDAFEINQMCRLRDRREVMCGQISRDFLRDLIDNATVSCLVRDIDPFQRAIAVCGTASVPDLNGRMVYEGMALAYTQFSRDYLELQNAAELAQAGAWEGYFMQPWNTRMSGLPY